MNHQIKTIIVDDEQNSIDALLWELELFNDSIEIITTCTNPLEAITEIKKHQPQLIFLDIEMPQMNGFEMLKKLDALTFDVIFTTAYNEFALQAFRVNAIDYLLKPIDEDNLKTAIGKVKNRNIQNITQQRLETVMDMLRSQNPTFPNIGLPTMDGLEFIEIARITHCQSEGNYTKIFLRNSPMILVSKTLKDVEKMLAGHHFLRVHNSYLVNLVYVKKYYRGKNGYLELQNKVSIPVSRAKKEDFLNRF